MKPIVRIAATLTILSAALLLATAIAPSRFTLDRLRASSAILGTFQAGHPIEAALGYVVLYIPMAALSVPGALVVTVAGGALFGLGWGVVLASFSSSGGATLAMLASRFVARDLVARRLGVRLDAVNRGLAGNGWVYLASLRLAPVFPFALVNLLFGLTAFPARRFWLVSQICMLPATVVYVNAGTRLAALDGLSGLLSPPMLGVLLPLAVLGPASRVVLARLTRPA